MQDAARTRTRNVLVLYDPYALATEFVRQHLTAIRRHSRHNVTYAVATFESKAEFPLELFDALIIHFSVRMPYETMSPDFVGMVASFDGPKVLLIQDEYDMPRKSCVLIRKLGIQTVFTTVPENFLHQVYPPDELPGVTFRSCLTGYIPDELPLELVEPVSERPVWLAYRGRKLPVWYGQLGFEKFGIGVRMKAECMARGIPHDIEWEEARRINGAAWFEFMTRTRAVLGTESGANVMDARGDIRRGVEAMQSERPDVSEAELYELLVAPHENNVTMNQISPKIFEAIALKTGLVLFEGSYSGIIKPNRHFIPLRKDYRNVDDVFKRLADTAYLQDMIDRAYADIVMSGEYGYGRFVKDIDNAIETFPVSDQPRSQLQIFALVRSETTASSWAAVTPQLPLTAPISLQPVPFFSGRALGLWQRLPVRLRRPIVARLGPTARRLKARYWSWRR